jgi:hypothetical protein
MASAPFRVRLRLPSSKQETLSLTSPVTIQALLDAIQPFVDVDITKIGLRLAYPPKPLDLGSQEDWNRPVQEIGIKNGEGLVVTVEGPMTPVDLAATVVPSPTIAIPMTDARSIVPQRTESSVSSKRPLTPVKSTSPLKRGRGPSVQEEPPEIPVEGGSVVLRVMEDDNSCMYPLSPCGLMVQGSTR